MNQIEQKRFEDFIKGLGREELVYINRLVIERLKLIYQANSTQAMSNFNIGESVEFDGPDNIVIEGIILKLNKKTVSVKTQNGHQWNVAPQFLRGAKTR